MTIWEYIAQPTHPWFNTDNYTPLQIGMFLTGAILWVVVYLTTIKKIWKHKELDIPFYAVILNFGCEITTAIFFVPDMGLALVLAYWVWMVLDILIVIGLLRYGYKQARLPELKKHFVALAIILFVFTFFIQHFFIMAYDLPMAPVDSFIINLIMSIAFIYLAYTGSEAGNSKMVAWCKFLGTGIIAVMFFTKYPDNKLLISLYLACALFDIIYIAILMKRKAPTIAQLN